LLSLNPRGYGLDAGEKIAMMKCALNKYQIDGLLLSATDRRWSDKRIIIMKNKMRSISRDVIVIRSDSSERIQSKNEWLPGGTMNIIFSQAAALIRKGSEKRDFLGRWSPFILEVNQKALMIITVYRIPDSTIPGILTSKAQ